MSCQDFISQASNVNSCNANVKFIFTFTNLGLSCNEIMKIKVALGPEGEQNIIFNDIYSYQERSICTNETWIVPDRRNSVDLCEESVDPWEIIVQVDNSRGQRNYHTYVYDWTLLSRRPSLPPATRMPSLIPSLSPSIDTCVNCSFTSIITASTFMTFHFSAVG